MNIGINTYLFTSPFNNDSVRLFKRFKDWGFDSVEIALENAAHIDAAYIRKELDHNGLKCHVVCAATGPDTDLRGTADQQQNALHYITGLMDAMVVLNASVLCGPVYSSVGRADAVSPDEYRQQWETVKAHLKTLSAYAEERGLKIAMEPLNRFETDFMNTVDQGLQMVREVGSPALGLHLDTFHMNIEEKDQADAILKAGSRLFHFHACGSDRGTPGNDHIHWTAIVRALKQVGYKGSVNIESFTPDVKVIARAAAIWRQIEPSQESIATNGLDFLKNVLA
ncbi:sugar phosphate isomerase/epimerase family protein [Hufsiella ginkgonis]|uniref:TIM barrel protein n=1 Tax=Hufsiella ginkgonis TaxID=2695274 RepID=A0A7K1XX57_9SPHI|nr:sugar phosphate isomerase/epimerase [Hufsiella ginkgonis]MXV15417.1 TIM barrel protein [Hufsiella ginkgonis]